MRRTVHYKPGERFIVKVQVAVYTSERQIPVLIYDEHRIIEDQRPLTPEMEEILRDETGSYRAKAFFWAEVIPDGSGGLLLNIDTEHGLPPWQEW